MWKQLSCRWTELCCCCMHLFLCLFACACHVVPAIGSWRFLIFLCIKLTLTIPASFPSVPNNNPHLRVCACMWSSVLKYGCFPFTLPVILPHTHKHTYTHIHECMMGSICSICGLCDGGYWMLLSCDVWLMCENWQKHVISQLILKHSLFFSLLFVEKKRVRWTFVKCMSINPTVKVTHCKVSEMLQKDIKEYYKIIFKYRSGNKNQFAEIKWLSSSYAALHAA